MRRRIGAYGICRDGQGRVLLARGSALSAFPGRWTLPGGGVDQGEHPDDTVVREFAEETGLRVISATLRGALAELVLLPDGGPPEHNDRLIYDVRVDGGVLRAEAVGTTDLVDWAGPDELAGRPLLPFTARVLGLPAPAGPTTVGPTTVGPTTVGPTTVGPTTVGPTTVGPSTVGPSTGGAVESGLRAVRAEAGAVPAGPPVPVQRFGAYALATDPAGRVLLTRISADYPGGGLWHLPGGGTDYGEQPEAALARELFEETGQHGRIVGLLGVSHRHDPAALGPERVPIDWHVVRVLFRVLVDAPTAAVVTEAAGGSTAAAGWFRPAELPADELTEVARSALRQLTTESAQM